MVVATVTILVALAAVSCGGNEQRAKNPESTSVTDLVGIGSVFAQGKPSAGKQGASKRSARKTALAPKPAVPLGMNLSNVNYYARGLPFVDIMKMRGDFHSTNATWVSGGKNAWDTQLVDKIPMDDQGWPLELPFAVPGAEGPQAVRAAVAPLVYPGRYTVLYDGEGEVEVSGGGVRIESRAPGKLYVQAERKPEELLFLVIKRSTRGNHVRNVRVLLPGFEQHPDTQFHPDFVRRLQGMSVLRFMDWGLTNERTPSKWSERAKPEGRQSTRKGVSLEAMIDVANLVGADPWLCVPHAADDQYIEEMAKLIKARLDPKRRFYVEYSNEIWNGVFPQANDAADLGCKAGYNRIDPYAGDCSDAGVRAWAATKWTAKRSADIFETFGRVFGTTERMVRVLAGQSGWAYRNEVLLDAFHDAKLNPKRVELDAFAIAPYFGGGFADEISSQKQSASITVEQVLDRAEQTLPEQVAGAVAKNKALADRHGVRLVGYEGGQHMVAFGPAGKDDELTKKLVAANRHPRMAKLYDKMLDSWYQGSGNDLMVLYSYVFAPGRHGSWGVLEDQLQPTAESPKYQAVKKRLDQLLSKASVSTKNEQANSVP